MSIQLYISIYLIILNFKIFFLNRQISAEHESLLLAADERAARRWADQAERSRVEHEEEKLSLQESERERARERISNELAQIEADNAITRER